MGQKVNPISMRLGIIRDWDSRWFANKRDYKKLLHEDIEVRKHITKTLKDAGVSRIEILRNANQVTLNIHTSRPGIVIGSQGASIEKLRTELEKKFNGKFQINIKEIKKPYHDAHIVAELVANQIERRMPHRRACKTALDRAMESGVKGIKIRVGGRLNGVEIARSQFFTQGKIPLQTFRANIDYACIHARTSYGTIGVRVWIYLGEIFNQAHFEMNNE